MSELLSGADFAVEKIDLDNLPLAPLNRREYEKREQLLAAGEYGNPMFDYAKQFAAADLIVVAAPFWDMGIPAKLKTYFENVSVSGFTFRCTEDGSCGLCRAKAMVYITTRGMDIADGSAMEQASPYLRALNKFFNTGEFSMVSACSLDTKPHEADKRVKDAVQRAEELAKKFK